MLLEVMLLHLCDFIPNDLVPIVLAAQYAVGVRESEIDVGEVPATAQVMENKPAKVSRPKPLEAEDNRVFFLIHEGEGDRQIADQVNRELGDSLPTIAEPDPLRTKGIIGRCDLVISSRFHALVSALSQGVPALGTGWSHKYQMLFEDYGFPEGLLDVRDDDQKIDVILQTVFYKNPMRLKEKLLSTAKGEKAKTQDMWARVFETIAQK